MQFKDSLLHSVLAFHLSQFKKNDVYFFFLKLPFLCFAFIVGVFIAIIIDMFCAFFTLLDE